MDGRGGGCHKDDISKGKQTSPKVGRETESLAAPVPTTKPQRGLPDGTTSGLDKHNPSASSQMCTRECTREFLSLQNTAGIATVESDTTPLEEGLPQHRLAAAVAAKEAGLHVPPFPTTSSKKGTPSSTACGRRADED